ncbi:hypothetical protein MNBD_CHLOROFLEXI01-3735, partial [hydrothermal vent metagenome]
MKFNNFRGLLLLLSLFALTSIACGLSNLGNDGPPSDAVVVNVVANTTVAPWLETAVTNFNASETATSSGDPAYVVLNTIESGQAIAQLQNDP